MFDKVQGPVPRKIVKFNPWLTEILSKVFLSKNMSLEPTKYCGVFNSRISEITQIVILSNA